MARTATTAALISMTVLTACSGQSRYAKAPMGISSNINGLQQSQCNCGGIEPKKTFEARRKAEAKAQRDERGDK